METESLPFLNKHHKEEFPPMHTAEHILNGTMNRLYHCGRAFRSHVEKTKTKLDYHMNQQLSQEQIIDLEKRVNEVINANLPVKMEFAKKTDVADRFDLKRLPNDASKTVRIVHVGDYDECLCIGKHVENTSMIGHFRISSTNWQDSIQRIVFRLDQTKEQF